MTTQISPYLGFNGKCREAMTFYKECFGGELMIQTVAETPVAHQCPEAMQHHVMHSMLSRDSLVLMATDMTGTQEYVAGNDIALALNFDSEEELNRCFSKLSEGGRVLEPLKESFWGSIFGMVQDNFGKFWMFNYDKNKK